MKKSIFMVAAMLGLMATSCDKENQKDLTQTPITINATYMGSNTKVAYSEDGNHITAKWQSGDKLLVIYNNRVNTLDLVDGAGESAATFSGTISGTPSEGAMLVCYVKDQNTPAGTVTISGDGSYIYTSDAFLGQDGTLASAAKLNLYGGWTRYSTTSDINCSFSINTSMMKFKVYAPEGISEGTTGATLTYKSGSTELAKATFTVGTDGINTIYLTIPAGHYTGEQTLVYHSGNITEIETLSSSQANFVAGQTYSRNSYFTNSIATPLTFEARTAGATVTFTPATGMTLPIEYSTDGSTWFTYNEPITLLNVGDIVSFRGNNAAYGMQNAHSVFTCSAQCYIYGNIMSLINSSCFPTITTLTEDNDYAFKQLFSDLTNTRFNIDLHPTKQFLLPALELSNYCYDGMFYGCCNMTVAPNLPATTLAESCYSYMFCGAAITTAPVLPATIMSEHCYHHMFEECRYLTIPPDLPATTLANSCYSYMFSGCWSLTTAPELPATSLTSGCYDGMFHDCTQLSSAPDLPATTLASSCYSNMFYGCRNLTTAPDLPASSMVGWCYSNMFKGCTNLNHIKCLTTYFSVPESWMNPTLDWLDGVSATGTFIKAAGVNWETGVSGIPTGWTVQEE